MEHLNMTDSEKALYIAVWAARWHEDREFHRQHGGGGPHVPTCADEAWNAVAQLRKHRGQIEEGFGSGSDVTDMARQVFG